MRQASREGRASERYLETSLLFFFEFDVYLRLEVD